MKYGYSSSTPPRMSAASSVCSDDSFEIVNNELDAEEPKDDVFDMYKPKVTFHEVFDVYPTDADIVARITFDGDFVKSDNDTIVVLPIAWKSVDQAVCAANIVGDFVRFDVNELPKVGVEDKFYQLCYCTGEKIVMGVSIPFSFREVHEDELVEFQKEQNKEFWTFRSRFAVLTDIYWNFLLKNGVKMDSVKSSTNADQLTKVLDNDEKQNYASTSKSESDSEKNHIILLYTMLKTEYEELKEQYETERKLSAEKISKWKSALNQVLQEYHGFDNFELDDDCNDIMKKINQKFAEREFKELDRQRDTRRLPLAVENQRNNALTSNAAFIATSSGDILLAPQKHILEESVTSEVVSSDTSASNNVPDDWKAEKASLTEKCAALEAELSIRNKEIEDLKETLINQRQSEVEKIITVTDNIRERYIKDMNKLEEQNMLLEEQLRSKNEEIENLNKNVLEMSKLLTANEDEIRNLKARDHSLVGFLERRNLKRISELEDRLHDLYSKMWSERKETIQLREDLLTSQALFNSLREEKDKPNAENLTTENSAQTGTESSAEEGSTSEATEQYNASSRNGHDAPEKPASPYLEHQIQSLLDEPVPKRSKEQSGAKLSKPLETPILPKIVSADSNNTKEKEMALATKLVEVSAELGKMKELYAKTKVDLEARLKDGAKQYAKLYMKYERHVKRLGSSTPKSST